MDRRRGGTAPPKRERRAGVYLSYHHTLFAYLQGGREEELLLKREEPTRSLTRRLMSLVPWRNANGDQAIRVLKSLQTVLESSLAEIVRTKSIYYWLHLSRRFAPGANFADENQVTIFLYSSMEDCGYLKYGKLDSSDDFMLLLRPEDANLVASGNLVRAYEAFGFKVRSSLVMGSEYVKDLDFQSLVQHAAIGRLAFEYWYTTACLRRLYKGGTLFIGEDPSDYRVENDSETEGLMESYDWREAHNGVLTTTVGLPISIKDIRRPGAAIGFYPIHNAGQVTEGEVPQARSVFGFKTTERIPANEDYDFTPNFLWVPVDFSRILEMNEFCEAEFFTAHGVSLAKYLACLYAVSLLATKRHIFTGNKFAGFEAMQRAYSVWISLGALGEAVFGLASDACKYLQPGLTITRAEVGRILNLLLLTDASRKAISLTTLGPRPLLIPAGGGRVLVDYAALAPILHSFAHGLENVSDKGARFEEYVKRVVNELPGATPLWFSRRLHAADGSSREVDASFIKGRVLFLCELKCITKSWAFVEGTQDALEFRKGKCEKGLQEADDKARWLSLHLAEGDFSLPQEVSVIVPLLVSPFVEYVWSRDPMLWLTDDLPRICAPRELEDLDPDAAASRPFAVKVTAGSLG